MSKQNEKADVVLYLRKFPRELKRKLRVAAINEGKDLQEFVPLICEYGLAAWTKVASN